MSGTTRPKLLVVTPWFPTLSSPGAGIFVVRDVLSLSHEFDITVVHVGAPQFFGDLAQEPVWAEFALIRSPFSFSDYRSILSASAVIRKELRAADLLHTMALGALTPLVPVRVRVPWIHTEHWSGMLSDPQGSPRSRKVQTFLRGQLRRPDRVVAVSELLAAGLEKWSKSAVAVIPNAVTLPSVLPRDGSWNYSQLKLISVGALVESKGVHDALEALIILNDSGRDATLTFVGDGPLRDSLAARAREAGVAERVHIRGQLAPEEVQLALQDANFAVMPTRFETFGVAIAEAVAAGLPIVTGSYGGFRDFLSSASSRMVHETKDEPMGSRVARAVLELSENPNLPTRRAIAEDAALRFNEESRLRAYLDLYRSAGRRDAKD